MKLTTLIALIIIATIHESKCEVDVDKYRLSRVMEHITQKVNRHYRDEIENEISRAFDLECVRKFLKLPQNGKMMVKDVEELIFIFASGLMCSDEDKVFETIFTKYIHEGWKERLTWLQWHLKQQVPTHKLIENFEINKADVEKFKENEYFMKKLKKAQRNVEVMTGPLNIYTCGAVSENGANDFLTFISKGALIRYGNISEELRTTEKEKLKDYFKNVAVGTVECITRKFEDDPGAFLVNDTLNYYFNKELLSIQSDEFDSDDYSKYLSKVKEAIDYDCVKEKLNLPENGQKTFLEVEATLFIASAKSKCTKTDILEFSEFLFNLFVEDDHRSERYKTCTRQKLQKLDPTSKLALTHNLDYIQDIFCEYAEPSSFYLRKLYGTYSDYVGSVNDTTCGLFTEDIVNAISFKTILLADEMDKELKINETRELFKFASDKLYKLAECILERNN